MEKPSKNAKIRYPVQTARTADEVWKEFNSNREQLDLSWNQFIKHINQLLKQKP